jgi:hypothetical protein
MRVALNISGGKNVSSFSGEIANLAGKIATENMVPPTFTCDYIVFTRPILDIQ